MVDGTRIMAGMTLLSPWFPRGGDFVVVAAECVRAQGLDPLLTIELFHKNSDDPGSGSAVDTSGTKKVSLSAVGRQAVDWKKSGTVLGCKELVRYKFTMTGDAGNFMLFRMLPPAWYDDVAEA